MNKNIKAEKIRETNNNEENSKLPLSGIYNVKIKDIDFDMLTIKSDDTSIVDRFWNYSHKDFTLEKWIDWCKTPGIYIDVGAHTGFFTISCLKSNLENHVVSIEPLSINFHRIITNLRLNNFNDKNATLFNYAASNENKKVKFNVNTEWSYLSKGGKISNSGVDIQAIKLDELNFNDNPRKIRAIKIDTEGEDLNVLYGAKNLIEKNRPKIIVETRKNNFNEIINFLSEIGYNKIYNSNNKFTQNSFLDVFQENIISRDFFFELE